MKIGRVLLFILLFIVITTYASEYLLNRSESDLLFGIFIVLEIVLGYFLIYKPLKSIIQK